MPYTIQGSRLIPLRCKSGVPTDVFLQNISYYFLHFSHLVYSITASSLFVHSDYVSYVGTIGSRLSINLRKHSIKRIQRMWSMRRGAHNPTIMDECFNLSAGGRIKKSNRAHRCNGCRKTGHRSETSPSAMKIKK